jgi:hypothetical protein
MVVDMEEVVVVLVEEEEEEDAFGVVAFVVDMRNNTYALTSKATKRKRLTRRDPEKNVSRASVLVVGAGPRAVPPAPPAIVRRAPGAKRIIAKGFLAQRAGRAFDTLATRFRDGCRARVRRWPQGDSQRADAQ